MKETASPQGLSVPRLVVTMFCMVAGGAYGLEEVIKNVGYVYGALVLFLLLPLWSAPISLLVGELASSIPASGGSYVWARRALGPFWGFQQAWLALTASIFDMAIYPNLVASNIKQLLPFLGTGYWPLTIGLTVIAIGVVWNLTGSQGVSKLSLVVTIAIVGLFLLLIGLVGGKSVAASITAGSSHGVSGQTLSLLLLGRALMGAMWNCMGWDNASTIASEVESPQITYPRALVYTVLLVGANYCLPVLMMALTGEPADQWEMGHWVAVAQRYGGAYLAFPIALFGIVAPLTMFVTLMMSYTRIVRVLSRDGWLPPIFGVVHGERKIPVAAILACAALWSLSLPLGFDHLVGLDVMLYGGSLMLQFVTLIVLRIKEPNLSRPFRVPGGLFGAIAIAVPPFVLLIGALLHNRAERVAGMSAFAFGSLVAFAGVGVWALRRNHYRDLHSATEEKNVATSDEQPLLCAG